MIPDKKKITLGDNVARIEALLTEVVLRPRRDFIRWAQLTKQTPNMKIGYPGQHLASLISGMEGERTGARGHDLCDGSEVKSCSRVDQLDTCQRCEAAVARIEASCPECGSGDVKRNNDSKWLISVRSQEELDYLLGEVPRVLLIITDYLDFESMDWSKLRIQAFEIWPASPRHRHFRTLMENYRNKIFLPHVAKNPGKSPAPKNFWPYSFQFFMCNPVRTFFASVSNANVDPAITIHEYVAPDADRGKLLPVPMPWDVLNKDEQGAMTRLLGSRIAQVKVSGLSESDRSNLELRDTDRAVAHEKKYKRGG